jgi:hypothetical protein
MKILLIGTGGIPANYSGFEICVQEETKRLENKYELIVFARKGHYDSHTEKIGNIRMAYLPALNSKLFETLSHTFLSVFHALIFHWSTVYMVFTEDIIIPGYIFDKNILAELRNHSLTYIHGNQVGGTNPALLEAIGSHCLVIARDVRFNREVLENGGLYYHRNETNLAEQMTKVYKNEIDRNAMISFCILKIKTYYNWDRIAVEYEKMIVSL